MKSFKYIISICLIISFSFPVISQQYKLKGHVFTQKNNHPLGGVFIQQKENNKTSTISNPDGSFELKVSKNQGKLQLVLIGFHKKTVNYSISKAPLKFYLQPNTKEFNEVKVSAYGVNKTIKETSGSVAHLSAKQIDGGSGISLQQGLNRIPGVRMDQSNSEDSRISIRGNGVRSPWGMRNIKVYINDIPVTETDGTTRIESLDVPALGSATIIKGPASSIYGAGTGGVIKFQLKRSPYQEQSIEASGIVGSYGLNREQLTYRGGSDKFNSYVSYGHQYLDGYRNHSSDQRDFFTANFQLYPSNKRTITLLVSRSSQKALIPGAITEKQVNENPRQAAQSDIDADAGRMQNWTRIGLGQKYHFNDWLSNKTSLYTYFYDLHHPLPFGIIRNFYQSYGGRTLFNFKPKFKILPTTFTVGGEFDQALTKGAIYVNNQGKEGNLFSNTDYNNIMFTAFAQAEVQLWKVIRLEAGISYNYMNYNVTDYLHPADGGNKRFTPKLSPRFALSHNFGDWLSLHGSISYGFNNPTTTQIQNADQTLNKTIQSVEGTNYEIDAKGNFFHSRFVYSLSLYEMDMKGELIPQTISPSVTIYHNSGNTNHKGAELGLSYAAFTKKDKKAFTQLNPYASITYSDFIVTNYKVLNNQSQVIQNFDGKQLIGIAPWTVSAGVDFATKIGFYGNINYYFNNEYPLNDRNTDYNPSYSTLNAKIGYKVLLWKHFGVQVFAGLKNITDTQYTSFTALNSVSYGGMAPTYYNPSPGRNWYAGLKLKYKIK